ncbi:MAG: hypothetical protein ACK5E6_04005 [Cyanobacteriota bacterium]
MIRSPRQSLCHHGGTGFWILMTTALLLALAASLVLMVVIVKRLEKA